MQGVRKEGTKVLRSHGSEWVQEWKRPCWVCRLRSAGWCTNLVCSDANGQVVGVVRVQHCEECGRLDADEMLARLNG